MVIEFILLCLLGVLTAFMVDTHNRIVNAGKTTWYKVYPGTKIPMEPEHESSFANTAMWMEME